MQVKSLKDAISKKGMTVTSLSKLAGISRETLYNRMSSGDFKASEISSITNVLSLTKKERDDIFFTQ